MRNNDRHWNGTCLLPLFPGLTFVPGPSTSPSPQEAQEEGEWELGSVCNSHPFLLTLFPCASVGSSRDCSSSRQACSVWALNGAVDICPSCWSTSSPVPFLLLLCPLRHFSFFPPPLPIQHYLPFLIQLTDKVFHNSETIFLQQCIQ